MPAESPGTSFICMSSCPNKNIWFEEKPAPIKNKKSKNQIVRKLHIAEKFFYLFDIFGFYQILDRASSSLPCHLQKCLHGLETKLQKSPC